MSAITLSNYFKLKNASLVYVSNEPPDDTSYLWLDTNTSRLMYFDGSWQTVDTGSSSGTTESNVTISVNPPNDITKLWFDTATHKLKYYDTVWKTIDAETILGVTIDNNASSGSLWTSDKITNELNEKADINHVHGIPDIDGLQNELDSKANVNDINNLQQELNSHTHTVNDLTDYVPSVYRSTTAPNDTSILWFDLNVNQLKYYNGQYWVSIDIETIKGFTINNNTDSSSLWTSDKIVNELNTKADVSHNHNISDINNLQFELDNKANINHNHDITNINNLQNILDSKVDVNHTHTINEITDYVTVIQSDTEPTNTNIIWYDTSTGQHKMYDSDNFRWRVVKFEESEGYTNFDNNINGNWTHYIRIPINTVPTESIQYKLEINGNILNIFTNDGQSILLSETVSSTIWSKIQHDGRDIRVFDEFYTQSYFYIEEFDYSNHKLVLWVKLNAGQQLLNIAFGNNDCNPSVYNNLNQTYDYEITDTEVILLLSENQGTVAYDSSNNQNNATIYGATWNNGKLQFDGVNDFMKITNISNLTEYTIVVNGRYTVKPSEIGATWWIYTIRGHNINGHYCFECGHYGIQPSHLFKLYYDDGITINNSINDDDTDFHFWVYGVKNDDKCKLGAIDKQIINIENLNVSKNIRSLHHIYVGGYTGGGYAPLELDYVLLFNRMLTNTELYNLHDNYWEVVNGNIYIRKKLANDIIFDMPQLIEF